MCFGDSSTWGQDQATRERLRYEVRWPGVLQLAMGERVRVVETPADGSRNVRVPFLDASSAVTASSADSIHVDAENHRKLAAAIRAKVEAILT